MAKRIVVAGCRDFCDYTVAKEYIDECLAELGNEDTFIFVSGACRGADMLGERYASEHGFEIERYPAQWNLLGKSAGPVRNRKMAELSDLVICFWDGESRGTASMIRYAEKIGKTVKVKDILR